MRGVQTCEESSGGLAESNAAAKRQKLARAIAHNWALATAHNSAALSMKTASASSIENSRSSKLRFTLGPHHVLNIKYQQKKKTVFAASPRTYQALRGAALSMKTASARSIENSRSSKLRFTLRPHHVLNCMALPGQAQKHVLFSIRNLTI